MKTIHNRLREEELRREVANDDTNRSSYLILAGDVTPQWQSLGVSEREGSDFNKVYGRCQQ